MFFRSHETQPVTSADLLAWLSDLRSLLDFSQRTAPRDRTVVRLFASFVTEGPYRLMVAGAVGATTATVGATAAATFGVFCWLEVIGFDFTLFFIFLCFLLHITFQLFVVSVEPNSN
jgi:hypothetical protein